MKIVKFFLAIGLIATWVFIIIVPRDMFIFAASFGTTPISLFIIALLIGSIIISLVVSDIFTFILTISLVATWTFLIFYTPPIEIINGLIKSIGV